VATCVPPRDLERTPCRHSCRAGSLRKGVYHSWRKPQNRFAPHSSSLHLIGQPQGLWKPAREAFCSVELLAGSRSDANGHNDTVRSCPFVSHLASGHQTYVNYVPIGVPVSVHSCPTCPLERAKLGMGDTIFRDRPCGRCWVAVIAKRQWHATRIWRRC
jgi:hypothetical protein